MLKRVINASSHHSERGSLTLVPIIQEKTDSQDIISLGYYPLPVRVEGSYRVKNHFCMKPVVLYNSFLRFRGSYFFYRTYKGLSFFGVCILTHRLTVTLKVTFVTFCLLSLLRNHYASDL